MFPLSSGSGEVRRICSPDNHCDDDDGDDDDDDDDDFDDDDNYDDNINDNDGKLPKIKFSSRLW